MNDILTRENIPVKYGIDNGLSFFIDNNPDRHFGSLRNKNDKDEATVYIDALELLQIVGGGKVAFVEIRNFTWIRQKILR